MAQQQDMSFMEIMQDAMGKRERGGQSYNERDYAARSMANIVWSRAAGVLPIEIPHFSIFSSHVGHRMSTDSADSLSSARFSAHRLVPLLLCCFQPLADAFSRTF